MQDIFIYFIDFRNFENVSFCLAANGTADMRPSIASTASGQYEMFQRRQHFVDFVHFRLDFLHVFCGYGTRHCACLRSQVTANGEQVVLNLPEKPAVVFIASFFKQAGDESVQFINSSIGFNSRTRF